MPITEAFIESLTAYPIYTWTVLSVVILGIVSFVLLMFVSAPYGRHLRPGWGPTLNARALWVIMEAPSPIAFAVVYFTSDNAFKPVPLILLSMYMFHYLYRAFIYPFQMRGGHKQKPLVTGLVAFAFNTANGSTNAFAITTLAPHLWSTDWLTDPRFILGIIVFATGYAINRHSDAILMNLRPQGESGYKIPQGGLYRWLSSPNYFGEIVEWVGFALAAWTAPAWVFAWFTGTNLIPRAFSNHRWYREHFREYPEDRRAILPFLL
jgi:3-oxo-5-alpha-steroid 4-dehydrogenase 1